MERFGKSETAAQAGTVDVAAPGKPDAAARAAGTPDDFAARTQAMDWHTERAVGASDRPAPEGPAARPALGPAPAETVERLSRLVAEEAALVRRHRSESLSVVLRPDAGTELYVHLSRKDGQVEAVVRCERGDFVLLNGLWGQLQESLARHQVRLAPLQESNFYDGYKPADTAANLTGGEPNLSRRPAPDVARNDSLDPRPAPAPPTQASESTTRRSGPRQSTSRPGWESWA